MKSLASVVVFAVAVTACTGASVTATDAVAVVTVEAAHAEGAASVDLLVVGQPVTIDISPLCDGSGGCSSTVCVSAAGARVCQER